VDSPDRAGALQDVSRQIAILEEFILFGSEEDTMPSMMGSIKMGLFGIVITLGSCRMFGLMATPRTTAAPLPRRHVLWRSGGDGGKSRVTREEEAHRSARCERCLNKATIMTAGDSKIKIRFAEDSLVRWVPRHPRSLGRACPADGR
jgi:hypothetical protein